MAFDIDQIFQETNGGLDIIRWYVKDIDDFVGTNKHFRMRDADKSESCAIKKTPEHRYIVTDFGGGGSAKPRNAIALVQHEENCTYGEALKIIVTRHNLSFGQEVQSLYTAKFRKEDASPDEKEGLWEFGHLEEWPDSWIDILFSRYAIADVEYKHKHIKEEDRKKAVYDSFKLLLTNQNWHPLSSYSIVKERKKTIVESQDHYPIISIEEESTINGKKTKWKKIYQPKNKDKKFRFMYYNGGDRYFLHGLVQLRAKVEKLRDQKQKEAKSNDDTSFQREKIKLENVFFSTGGSDAINKAAIGFECVYGASEYFKLSSSVLKELRSLAHNICTCPDLDYTGQRENLALCFTSTSTNYLDIKTVDLPVELQYKTDQYLRKCKDVRDYLNYFNASSFRNLVKMAKPMRFWDSHQALDRDGNARFKFGRPVYEYKISIERMLNFLIKNGFGRYETMPDFIEYIHVKGSVVSIVKPEQIKSFVINFLRQWYMEEGLIDTVHKSPILSDTHFTQLPELELDFRDAWFNTQLMYFPKKTIKIDDKGITEVKNEGSGCYVWESQIIQKPFSRLLDPMFNVLEQDGRFKLTMLNNDCIFNRFLIQTSRVHWRKELEDNLDDLSLEEIEKYKSENRFNISGPNLTDEERYEQELHLMSKYYALGYLVHRYKDPSRSWSVVAMDDTPNEDGLPQGGTGKSIFFEAIKQVREQVFLNGKKDKLFDDSHVLEQITRKTDSLYIDDAAQGFDFEQLFSLVTGDMTVNPKGKTRVSLDKSESPKISISTNYTPGKMSGSLLRRILFLGMSNYFHNNKLGEFREERTPVSDLGKSLFSAFDDNDWNNFLNLLIQCSHLYLSTSQIEAPMKNIMERNILADIGLTFLEWAENYFNNDMGTIDIVIPVKIALEDFKNSANMNKYSAQLFNSKLRLFAQFKGWRYNPKDLLGKSKRFSRRFPAYELDNKLKTWSKSIDTVAQDYFYLQTEKETGGWNEVNGAKVYDPTFKTIPADGFPTPLPGTEKPNFT